MPSTPPDQLSPEDLADYDAWQAPRDAEFFAHYADLAAEDALLALAGRPS